MFNSMRHAIRRVLRSVFRRLPPRCRAVIVGLYNLQVTPQTKSNLMLKEFGASWAPLPIFKDRATVPTVTVLTDSVDADSLFGGVGTSLVVGILAARQLNARLRLVTRTTPPDPAAVGQIIKAHKLDFSQSTDFVQIPLGSEKPLALGSNDLIITTSWWGTRSVLGSVSPDRIVYLLQEDERMFYPYGDTRLRCVETLSETSIRMMVNTRLLFDHLADGPHPLPQLRQRGIWFEPAFPTFTRPSVARQRTGKKNFFFYARPNHPRNLYWRGLEVIDKVMREGLLPAHEWDINFAGHDLGAVELPGGVKPKIWSKMPWAKYAEFVSQMDLGLSLMDTPHPSYPPLDLAASGAVVVTNTHGQKASLNQWSKNILAVPPAVADLSNALRKGVELATDTKQRFENCVSDRIERDWEATLKPALDLILAPRSS